MEAYILLVKEDMGGQVPCGTISDPAYSSSEKFPKIMST